MIPTGTTNYQVVDALELASAAAKDHGLIHDPGAGTPENSVAALIRTLPVTKVLVQGARRSHAELGGDQRGDLWLM